MRTVVIILAIPFAESTDVAVAVVDADSTGRIAEHVVFILIQNFFLIYLILCLDTFN